MVGGVTLWEDCQATLANGVLSLSSITVDKNEYEKSTHAQTPQQQQIHLYDKKVHVIDASRGQFSLMPVSKQNPPHQNHTHSLQKHTRFSGSNINIDTASPSFNLASSMDTYSSWLLALEDAVKVCHVKTLLGSPTRAGDRYHTQMQQAAVQWYKEQYESYERAMNTIEFGGMFVLHHVKSSSTCGIDIGKERETDLGSILDTGTTGNESTIPLSGIVSSVRIWLQAEEEDTGLVFFPAAQEEDEDDTPRAPSASASASESSPSCRKKSVSNVEPLLDRSRSGSNTRGARGSSGVDCSQPARDSDRESDTERERDRQRDRDRDIAAANRNARGGFGLPFHHIVSVCRGSTEKVVKSSPQR